MRNILIVAYEFYPINTGGSHRPYRMASFLKEKGFHPIIITSTVDNSHPKYDQSLANKLEKGNLEILALPIKPRNILSSLYEKYYFNLVDDIYKRWRDTLLPKTISLIEQRSVEAIIITLPPFGLSDFVFELKKQVKEVPIYIDMRDAWSQWNVAPYASILHYRATLRKEKKLLAIADKIFVTSDVTMQDLMHNHKTIPNEKFILLPNSFDHFDSIEKQSITVIKQSNIDIGYFGSFYYEPYTESLAEKRWFKKKPYQWLQYRPIKEEWIYRSPFFLFTALSKLFFDYPSYRDKIMLHFVGEKPQWLMTMITDFGLSDSVKLYGRLEKSKVRLIQIEMDFLLLTSSKRVGSVDYSIAGKTFEYISLQKPILGFVAEGAQKDILEKLGLGIIFDPDNIDQCCNQLKAIVDKGVLLKPNSGLVNNYLTRISLTPLIELLNRDKDQQGLLKEYE